jgi:hypothetical protein
MQNNSKNYSLDFNEVMEFYVADGTYRYVKGQPTTKLYQQHLEGKISLGIVPITDKGNCRFGALDLDDHKKDKIIFKSLITKHY